MKTEEMILLNNEKREQLTKENEVIYKDILLYLRLSNLSQQDAEAVDVRGMTGIVFFLASNSVGQIPIIEKQWKLILSLALLLAAWFVWMKAVPRKLKG